MLTRLASKNNLLNETLWPWINVDPFSNPSLCQNNNIFAYLQWSIIFIEMLLLSRLFLWITSGKKSCLFWDFQQINWMFSYSKNFLFFFLYFFIENLHFPRKWCYKAIKEIVYISKRSIQFNIWFSLGKFSKITLE